MRVTWVGGENLFIGNAQRDITDIEKRTDNNDPQLSFFIVLDPSKLDTKPDLLFVSEKTSDETTEALIGPSTQIVSVGKSVLEMDGNRIDRAISRFTRMPKQQAYSNRAA